MIVLINFLSTSAFSSLDFGSQTVNEHCLRIFKQVKPNIATMKIRGDKNSVLAFESQSVSHAVLPQLQLKSCDSVMRVIFSSCSRRYVIHRWSWIYLHTPFPRCTPASLQIDLFALRLSGLPRHKSIRKDWHMTKHGRSSSAAESRPVRMAR